MTSLDEALRALEKDIRDESETEQLKSQDRNWSEWVRDRAHGRSSGLHSAANKIQKLLTTRQEVAPVALEKAIEQRDWSSLTGPQTASQIIAMIWSILESDQAVADGLEFFSAPADLHPETANLVSRFAAALAEKLAVSQRKYGYSDGWASPGWMDECRAKLAEHIAKGDPRDVAAYCAFLWHHEEPTSTGQTSDARDDVVSELVSADREFDLAFELYEWANDTVARGGHCSPEKRSQITQRYADANDRRRKAIAAMEQPR